MHLRSQVNSFNNPGGSFRSVITSTRYVKKKTDRNPTQIKTLQISHLSSFATTSPTSRTSSNPPSSHHQQCPTGQTFSLASPPVAVVLCLESRETTLAHSTLPTPTHPLLPAFMTTLTTACRMTIPSPVMEVQSPVFLSKPQSQARARNPSCQRR